MERSRKIAVLAAVNVSVYSMIYMKGTFYNIMQSALRLSHEQLGTALSLYGMVALISYPLGGWIADSFSSRKMVVLSMGGTIVLGLALASLPSYSWLLLIFALFGVFSILTYYPVSTRLVKSLATAEAEGKTFGAYWSLISVLNVLVYALGIVLVHFFPENYAGAYRVLIYMILLIAAAALVCFMKYFRKDDLPARKSEGVLASWRRLVRHPQIWLIGLMILFSYSISCSVTYFTPYLTAVCGLSEEGVLWLNLVKGYVLGIAAPIIAGTLCDRIGSAVRLIGAGALMISLLTLILLGLSPENVVWIILTVTVLEFILQGLHGQVMVTLSECALPKELVGSAVGFVAFIGYSPDAFLYRIAGGMLDRLGMAGYSILFAAIAACGLMCTAACGLLLWQSRTRKTRTDR